MSGWARRSQARQVVPVTTMGRRRSALGVARMMTSRRHPAQASRIVAAGLSTATMLSIVAVLGARSSPATPQPAPKPAKVAVVLHPPVAAGRVPPPTPSPAKRGGSSMAGRAPDTTTGPS
jgi:hypothetical protein